MKTGRVLSVNSVAFEGANTAGEGWFHLVPLGDLPGVACNGDDEVPCIQRVTPETVGALVAAYNGGKLLVDFEHRSKEPAGDSTAAAWITELQARPDGLYGKFELSDLGVSSIANKRYRYLSPVLSLDHWPTSENEVVTPVSIEGAGFTNRPNFRGLRPMFNSAVPGAAGGAISAERGGKGSMDYKAMLCKKLGLPADADDAAIQAALDSDDAKRVEIENQKTEACNRATAAEAELAQFKARALEVEAEAFVAANRDRVADPVATKTFYIANKAACIQAFALVKPAGAAANPATHNRDGAKPPTGDSAGRTDGSNTKAVWCANRAREIGEASPRRSYRTCWEQAEAEWDKTAGAK